MLISNIIVIITCKLYDFTSVSQFSKRCERLYDNFIRDLCLHGFSLVKTPPPLSSKKFSLGQHWSVSIIKVNVLKSRKKRLFTKTFLSFVQYVKFILKLFFNTTSVS